MHSRGFTIIEILVVVSVLAILFGIAVVQYSSFQRKAEDNSRLSVAATVKTAAERYYDRNNEYPTSTQLFGGTPNGNAPASLNTAATLLDTPVSSLATNNGTLVPCAPPTAGCAPNASTLAGKTKVYYFSKNSTASQQLSVSGCTYTIPLTNTSDSITVDAAFFMLYWSAVDNRWNITKSNRGVVTTSNTSTCPFKSL